MIRFLPTVTTSDKKRHGKKSMHFCLLNLQWQIFLACSGRKQVKYKYKSAILKQRLSRMKVDFFKSPRKICVPYTKSGIDFRSYRTVLKYLFILRSDLSRRKFHISRHILSQHFYSCLFEIVNPCNTDTLILLGIFPSGFNNTRII